MAHLDTEDRKDDADGLGTHVETDNTANVGFKGHSAKTAKGRKVLQERNQAVGPPKGDLTTD